MTTETMVERELKLRLASEASWARLREALGEPQRRIHQTNTYFDTADRRLEKTRMMMVRVREAGQRIWVQSKDRVTTTDDLLISRERQAELTTAQWRRVHRRETALTQLNIALCRDFYEEVGDHLYPLGSMVNTRDVYPLADGYIAEVDRTELPGGGIDFEVEVELREPHHTAEGARAALPDMELDPHQESSPKYQRFLEALERLGD